ncbi:MAG: multidrug efflux SMR transporter [Clostridiales bacterium]|nr:multidrug efflux SMR transporter [Clostridiales bacterium]
MAYGLLGGAIALELIATTCLKYSQGFTRLWPTLGCIALYIVCFFLLSRALQHLPLGIAYATWCGVGVVASAVISAVVFGQKLGGIGIFSVLLIAVGCVLLNLFGAAH